MSESWPTPSAPATAPRWRGRSRSSRSRRADHRARAQALIQALLPHTGKAVRVGLTGVPGVGKSTAIDALGSMLTGLGRKVAVLAVDPSSTRTGGSILGDKTRMARLAIDANAFIRPSPSAGTLGGVASRTRETMLLCEAAGFDTIIIETVGIGQSETAVADMTDFFLVLMLPGAGDELQGIKKGVIEIADMIAVNKSDGDNIARARAAAAEYSAALHILSPRQRSGRHRCMISGATGDGLAQTVVATVLDHRRKLTETGEIAARRREQQVKWMWSMLEDRLSCAAALRSGAENETAADREIGGGRKIVARCSRSNRSRMGWEHLTMPEISPYPS